MSSSPRLNLVLVEPEIPPNTGAIARLCAASGTRLHLVEPLGFRLDDRAVKRAGLDYWAELDLKIWPSWSTLKRDQPDATSFYFFTTKARRAYTEASFARGDFLVLGRETRGLPESLLREDPERCLRIPMQNPAVRSLNLATAAAIVLFEAIRQIG